MPLPGSPLVTAVKLKDEESFHAAISLLLLILIEYILNNIFIFPWTIVMHLFNT
jgi:hypothetical protein